MQKKPLSLRAMNGVFLEGITKENIQNVIKTEIQKGFETAGIDMYLTTSEACNFLSVTPTTISNYHRSGKLTNFSPGTHDKWSLREVIKLRRKRA